MSTSVWDAGAWVALGGAGGVLADQHPGLLADGVDTATSVRSIVTTTAHATPFADGTWVEVDASLSAAASGIFFAPTAALQSNGADSSTLLEIGTGAAASETVWARVPVGYWNTGAANASGLFVPGLIASGTRVAVRARSAITERPITGVYSFLPVKSVAPAAPTTIGAATGTCQGVTLTAPGSTNTMGAWTELSASTTSAMSLLAVRPQGAGNTSMHTSGVLIDVGIGAAASETVLIGDIALGGNNGEHYIPRHSLTFGVSVPAGSRLSARYARANAGNAVDLSLIGA